MFAADVAAVLGTRPSTARRRMSSGEIEAVRVGHRLATSMTAIRKYLASRPPVVAAGRTD
jgi:hypothetical protein